MGARQNLAGRASGGREAAEHSPDGPAQSQAGQWAGRCGSGFLFNKRRPHALGCLVLPLGHGKSWKPLDQEGTSQGVRTVELVLACRGLPQRQEFKRLDLSKCKNLLIFPPLYGMKIKMKRKGK